MLTALIVEPIQQRGDTRRVVGTPHPSTTGRIAATSDASTLLHRQDVLGIIENSCDPMPSSIRVTERHPAISPHTARNVRLRRRRDRLRDQP